MTACSKQVKVVGFECAENDCSSLEYANVPQFGASVLSVQLPVSIQAVQFVASTGSRSHSGTSPLAPCCGI